MAMMVPRKDFPIRLSDEDIQALMDAFGRSQWDQARLVFGNTEMVISKSGDIFMAEGDKKVPQVAAEPESRESNSDISPAQPTSVENQHAVCSPCLGIFWRARSPGAAPFVEVGDLVEAGDIVCIVEVMKLMNQVRAGARGRIAAICAVNGEMVEYGQDLFLVEALAL